MLLSGFVQFYDTIQLLAIVLSREAMLLPLSDFIWFALLVCILMWTIIHFGKSSLLACFYYGKIFLYLFQINISLFLLFLIILIAIYQILHFAGVFAIKRRLTWATYVLYVCPYFVNIIKNVQPAGAYISFFSKNTTKILHSLTSVPVWFPC